MKQNSIFRRFILFGTPLALGILEFWHPSSVIFGELATSPEKATWWLILHLLQLPLFGLLALSMYYLLDQVENIFATIARIAVWFFLVFYTALDSIAGIATGIIFHKVQSLHLTNEADPLFDVVFELFLSVFSLDAPGASWISGIAVGSWFVAGLSATIALYLKGVNRVGIILVATATVLFHSHAYPNGTISMFLLLLGAVLLEYFPWKFTEVKKEMV